MRSVVGPVLATASMVFAVSLPPGGTFQDDNGSVHEASIEALSAAGITNGCNPPFNDRFCPEQPVTRGELAAFLTRAGDVPQSAIDRFVDDDGSLFEDDIDAISAFGVTTGCNPPRNDAFCPNRSVSRAEMATMLARLFAFEPGDEDHFTDDDASPHEGDINAIADAGVTFGCNPPANDGFCPDQPVTRAQMASFLVRALDLEPIVPPPPPPPPGTKSCITGTHDATGSLDVVPGETEVAGPGVVWELRVEIERGLAVDGDCFAAEVIRILNDFRGWGADGGLTFRRVDGGAYHFRLILASPGTTDDLCHPVPTGGIYSCRNGSLVVLNSWRWEDGAAPFAGDLVTYRQYLVNHEVGHRLGHSHAGCPQAGTPAPVMMQQTKFTAPCSPNGWPLASER